MDLKDLPRIARYIAEQHAVIQIDLSKDVPTQPMHIQLHPKTGRVTNLTTRIRWSNFMEHSKQYYQPAGLVAVVVAICCNIAAAGIIRHDRDPAEYDQLGEHPAFESVGQVVYSWYSGNEGHASAVLIAPQWALTAGHVAAASEPEHQTYIFGGERLRAVRCPSPVI